MKNLLLFCLPFISIAAQAQVTPIHPINPIDPHPFTIVNKSSKVVYEISIVWTKNDDSHTANIDFSAATCAPYGIPPGDTLITVHHMHGSGTVPTTPPVLPVMPPSDAHTSPGPHTGSSTGVQSSDYSVGLTNHAFLAPQCDVIAKPTKHSDYVMYFKLQGCTVAYKPVLKSDNKTSYVTELQYSTQPIYIHFELDESNHLFFAHATNALDNYGSNFKIDAINQRINIED